MSKKIIALDAGHGMYTAGKRCIKSIDPSETREWWLNDRIADRVQELLTDYACTVLRVDDTTGKKDISLSARVKTANTAKADIYISIHHNAGIKGGIGGGTVVFYYAGSADKIRAVKLYNAVTDRTRLIGNRSSKIVDNDHKSLYVVRNTKMPALLIENGFMDSRTDTPIILTQEHAEETAQGIVEFLIYELKLDKPETAGETISSGQANATYYPTYLGPKTTLSASMKALDLDASYAHRKLIAKANSITGYIGTAAQNTQMYNLLVSGLLKKE